MDIVVTVPKKEMKNLKEEDTFAAGKNVYQYWSVSKRPKYLNVGDKVYFVEDGKISYYHIFLGFKDDIKCEATGREWSGCNLTLQYPEIKLKNPIPMSGFQGFRYMKKV